MQVQMSLMKHMSLKMRSM